MKNLLLIPLAVLLAASVAQAQLPSPLAFGSSTTNFYTTGGSNWNVIANSRDSLVQRTIVNTNAGSALFVSFTWPVVLGTAQYNTFVTSNIYNGVASSIQTNIPPNVTVVGTLAATMPFAVFQVAASSSTNVTIGNELYGTYTNLPSTSTNRVFINDVYLQR